MNNPELVFTLEGNIGILTFTRPDRMNALTTPSWDGIPAVLGEIARNDQVKVLIVTGAGKGFSAGADLSVLYEAKKRSLAQMEQMMLGITMAFVNFPRPIIGAVNGAAAGAGLAIALLCDMRVGSEKAKFASGYLRMALIPDIACTYFLPRVVGSSKAMEILLTGDFCDANEALRIGLLDRLVPEAELMNAAKALAVKIASGPSEAIAITRKLIKEAGQNTLEQQIEAECGGFFDALKTANHEEGLKSFSEKRPPKFT